MPIIKTDSMEDGQLQTERLIIRPIMISDVAAVFKLYNQEAVCRLYDIVHFKEKTQAVSQVVRWLQLAKDRKQLRYALVLNQELIGTCGLYSLYWHQNRANLGFDLSEEYWRQGYMTEALSAFLPYCADTHKIHRLQALALQENEPSKRLLSKLGFANEGLLKDYEKC